MENQDLIPYIKISRTLFKHFLWKEHRQFSRFEAWVDLIQKASFSDNATEMIKGKIIDRKKGQVIGSLRFFSEAWGGWSTTKVSDFLEVLRTQNMISIDRLNGISVLTLLNFEKHSGKKIDEKRHKRQVIDEESYQYEEVGNTEKSQTLTAERQSANSEQTNIIKDKELEEGKGIRPKGLTASFEADKRREMELKKKYSELLTFLEGKTNAECWNAIKEFIECQKPKFIDPFVDAWNIFALNYKLIQEPIRITKGRREKLRIRVHEDGFDFFKIMAKIKLSDFYQGKSGNWKVSFDYILNSESNYVKILES